MLVIIADNRLFKLPAEINYFREETFDSHWTHAVTGEKRTSRHTRRIGGRSIRGSEIRNRFLRSLYPGFDTIVVKRPYTEEIKRYVYRGTELLGTFTEHAISNG